MTDDIYLVLFPAITTGIFTLGAVYLTNKQNSQQVKFQQKHEFEISREKIYRDKLEELYTLLNKHSLELLAHYHGRMSVMEGKISYKVAIEIETDRFKSIQVNFERLEMLVDLYFPDLRKDYDNYFSARDRVGEVVQDHKIRYDQGEMNGEIHYKAMLSKIDDLESALRQFKSMIASHTLPRS